MKTAFAYGNITVNLTGLSIYHRIGDSIVLFIAQKPNRKHTPLHSYGFGTDFRQGANAFIV